MLPGSIARFQCRLTNTIMDFLTFHAPGSLTRY
jgi:hypothetical protein